MKNFIFQQILIGHPKHLKKYRKNIQDLADSLAKPFDRWNMGKEPFENYNKKRLLG